MKKIILTLFVMVFSIIGLNAQVETCCYFDGFWSDWKTVEPSVSLYGNWDSFIMFDNNSGGKWEPQFKVSINNFSIPKKKQRKKDIKAKPTVWYEFEGTVEYYLPDVSYSYSIIDVFRNFKSATLMDATFLNEAGRDGGYSAKKVVSRATIKIQAFEKQPSCYNIYFDKVGVGFSFKAPNWKTFDD